VHRDSILGCGSLARKRFAVSRENGIMVPMRNDDELTAVDFFAGSGLVTEGLHPYFRTLWANDFCVKKGRVP
jgi:hypothetical protein